MRAEGPMATTDGPRRPSARATALVEKVVGATEQQLAAERWAERSIALSTFTQEEREREVAKAKRRSNAAMDVLLTYLAGLEAARDFYADPAHYGDSAKRIITADGSFANVCSVLADGGARARAVPR